MVQGCVGNGTWEKWKLSGFRKTATHAGRTNEHNTTLVRKQITYEKVNIIESGGTDCTRWSTHRNHCGGTSAANPANRPAEHSEQNYRKHQYDQ